MNDIKLMQRALQLAARGTGYVSPNPRVGAVIVKNGEIIGEGWHQAYGLPHAEVNAMQGLSDEQLQGAEMYVNLEPCSHQGQTPACAPLIVDKKLARVVVGMEDPNPLVAGSGIKLLKEYGIEVKTGIAEDACRWINRFFVKHITQKMPYTVAKIAQSLDGCIVTGGGASKWISCEESRAKVHKLRAELDAVMIGRVTAAKDNPQLNVRNVKGRNPKRIILDSNLSLPLGLKIFTDDDRLNTVVVYNEAKKDTRKALNLSIAGVSVLPVKCGDDGRIDLKVTLEKLSEKYNIASVLIEGGAKVYSTAINAGLLDELQIFAAPIILGNGTSAFCDFKTNFIKDAAQFQIINIAKSGTDLHLIATKKPAEK